MTRARSIALALVILLGFTLAPGMTIVPFASADSSPPAGMSGVATENITTELPENTPMGQVHEDLQEHGVYTSTHADTLEILVTNPGQAKQYTDGSVWGQGPIAMVFSDDEHSDAREVALPTEIIEDIFGYQPPVAYGTYEDGDQWAAPIVYDDGYTVFEVPHFSDQIVTMEGEISISSDSALSDDTWSYEVDDGESVDNLTLEFTGVDHIKPASTIQQLSDEESIEYEIGGNLPADVATLEIEGVRQTTSTTYSGLADDSDTFTLDGNTEGDITSVTVTGNEEIFSQSTSSSTFQIEGIESTDVTVELEGQNSVSGVYNTYSDSTDSLGTGNLDDSTVTAETSDYDGTDIIRMDDFSINVDISNPGYVDVWLGASGGTYGDDDVGVERIWLDQGSYDLYPQLEDPGWEDVIEHGERDSLGLRLSISDVDDDGQETASGEVDMSFRVREVEYSPENVEATLWGQTKSYSITSEGETDTAIFTDVEPGEHSIDVSTSSGSATVTDVNWDETQATEDPTITIDGETIFEYSGVLTEGETEEQQVDLSQTLEPGQYTLDLSQSMDAAIDWEVEVDEGWATEDASIDVDDGTVDTYTHDGVLEEGETTSWDLGSGQTGIIDVNASVNESDVIVNLTVDEVTETEDPEITINGEHTVSYDGTISDGETVDMTGDASLDWVDEGENNITVSELAPTVDGPAGKLGVNWRHSGDASKVVNHSGEIFSEVSSFEHTWAEDKDDATITVEWASDRVIRLGNLEVTHNGTVIDDPSYAFSESDIIIHLDDVEAGETTEVELTGWKIVAENGDIEVTSPTDEGIDLVTTFEVTETTAEALTLQVGGHDQGHLVHVLDESTDAPEDWDVRTLADGSQEVRIPDVAVDDSIRIETTDLEIWPNAGDVVIDPIDADADEPEFALSYEHSAGDSVDVTWHGAESGETYELYSQSDNRVVDTATASSPVSFSISDDPTTYLIQPYVSASGSNPPPAAPVDDTDALPGPLWLWVLGAVLASIFVLAFITNRFGDDEADRDIGLSVPMIDRDIGVTVPGLARSPILVGGMTLVGIIAIEALTPRTLFSPDAIPVEQIWVLTAGVGLILSIWAVHTRTRIDLPDWLQYTVVALVGLGMLEFLFAEGLVSLLSVELGIALETGEVAQVLIGIGILLALWQVDTRTAESIPLPILAAAGAITIVWVLETIQPGVILGGLSEGFATVSPLFWLIVVVGGAYFARAYIRAQRAPDTQVQLQLDGGDD